jgi:outer membrane autotransporter protein
VIASQTSPGAAARAFDQISGEIHASAKSALIEESRFPRDAVFGRLRSAFDTSSSSSSSSSAGGLADAAKPCRFDDKEPGGLRAKDDCAAWGRAFGAWGSFDGDGNAARLGHSISGLFVGVDAPVAGNARLGLL